MRGAALLAVVLAGCGARTGFVTSEDAAIADARPEADVDDTSVVVVDDGASADVTTDPPCPAHRPLVSDGCDPAREGASCLYGDACRVECVCERGSWVCASDTCAESCPGRVPATLPCPVSEIDRVCEYPRGCPTTCRCDAVAGGARWSCLSPPC